MIRRRSAPGKARTPSHCTWQRRRAGITGRTSLRTLAVLNLSMLLGRLPRGRRIQGDRGFVGLAQRYDVIVPRRRSTGETLSPEDRALNHRPFRVRITVDSVVCRMRTCRVCQGFYRHDTRPRGLCGGSGQSPHAARLASPEAPERCVGEVELPPSTHHPTTRGADERQAGVVPEEDPHPRDLQGVRLCR